jgi:hypothetical protein
MLLGLRVSLLLLLAALVLTEAKRRHRGHLPIDEDPDDVNGDDSNVIAGAGSSDSIGDHGRNKKASGMKMEIMCLVL